MAGIVNSIESLVASIFNVFKSAIGSVVAFFQAIVVMILNFFKGVVDLVGGALGFVLSNIVIIGLLAGGYYVYNNYVMVRTNDKSKPVVVKKAA